MADSQYPVLPEGNMDQLSRPSWIAIPAPHSGRAYPRVTKRGPSEKDLYVANGYLESWPPNRQRLAKMFNSTMFEVLLCVVMGFNWFVVIIEIDFNANGKAPRWIKFSNTGLLFFYAFEIGLRVYTFRGFFFTDIMNNLDFLIISSDLVLFFLGFAFEDLLSISFMRLFRMFRLARSSQVMELSPELSLIVRGMRDTLKTLFWGALIIFLVLTLWSIVAVEYIHPINLEVGKFSTNYDGCHRCLRAYESVMQANLTFFQQIVAGDSWGAVTIPVIEREPVTIIFFVGVQVSVSLGLMNLLLAVIVDRAHEARQADSALQLKEEEEARRRLQADLKKICATMDNDSDEHISLEELQTGYEENDDFKRVLDAMEISEDDLTTVFGIMQNDCGNVNHEEFIDELWKLKTRGDHMVQMFTKFYIAQARNQMTLQLNQLQANVAKHFQYFEEQLEKHKEGKYVQQPAISQEVSQHESDKLKCDYIKLQEPAKEDDKMTQEIVSLRVATEEISALMKHHLTSSFFPAMTPSNIGMSANAQELRSVHPGGNVASSLIVTAPRTPPPSKPGEAWTSGVPPSSSSACCGVTIQRAPPSLPPRPSEQQTSNEALIQGSNGMDVQKGVAAPNL